MYKTKQILNKYEKNQLESQSTPVFEDNRALIIHCTESKILILVVLLQLAISCSTCYNSFLRGHWVILVFGFYVCLISVWNLAKVSWQYRSLTLPIY